MGSTSITISEEAKEQLAAHKEDGESWTEFGLRVASILENGDNTTEESDTDVDTADGEIDETLDTILSELLYLRNEVDDVPSQTASEIEGRLRQH